MNHEGFKAGLEIHQQLDTGKLFSRFPSIVHDTDPDFQVRRKLRAVAGEQGEVDEAASFEMQKGKDFLYIGCKTSAGLVELDEEPPQELDNAAFEAALEISLLLHAQVVDEIQFMRKTVIDGSNVSGFQRTALVAMNGYIDTSKGHVAIPTVCLEEEAAKKVDDGAGHRSYRLDRLGIPLIEVATDASLQSPEHVRDAAEIIGMILRSTGKVKRGLGTIRQDVNISIKGGSRTEIKGFQDLRSIQKVVENETERQLGEIIKGAKLKPSVRKAEQDFTTSFLRPMPGAARMYPETDIRAVPVTKESLASIKLPKLLSEKASDLANFGIDKAVAASIIREGKQEFYIRMFESMKNLKPSYIVDTFFSIRKQLEKDFAVTQVEDSLIQKALQLVDRNAIPKNILP